MFTLGDPGPTGGGRRKPTAIVIGAGFGGLAAAIRLGARGYRVTVLERLDAPGGRAYVYRQDGFTFDAGPTIVTAPFLFEELWRLCGRRIADDVELKAMDPFYQIRFADGETFAYRADPDAMRAEVERFSPGEAKNFDAFLEMSEAIYRIGFEQLGDVPFDSLFDMARIAPDLMRLQGYRSVYGLVSQFFRDERLRMVFSFHPLLIGGNPFRASSVYCLIAFLEKSFGVHAAIGGTGALVRGLVRLIQSQGNEVRCNSDVRRILIENGAAKGVGLESGERIAADIVVSNADSAWTYRHLVAPEHRRRWTDAETRPRTLLDGSVCLVFWRRPSLRRRWPSHDLDGPALSRVAEGHLRPQNTRQPTSASICIARPRPTPRSRRRAATRSMCCRLCPICLAARIGGSKAEPYRRRIADWLEANLLPDLSKHIVVSKVATPLDFRERLNATHGEGFGLEPLLTQSAWFRPHNRSDDVKNLFLVGAGVHPGAGLPGVLSSARILDKVTPNASAFV